MKMNMNAWHVQSIAIFIFVCLFECGIALQLGEDQIGRKISKSIKKAF